MAGINRTILVRGGGDIATGTICRLFRAGFRVLVLETATPTAIRRTVALSEAVYDGFAVVETVRAERIDGVSEAESCWQRGVVPVLVDPQMACLETVKPFAVVDCILAKKNTGMRVGLAPLTIALGPGFTAGVDADVVIETMRGHNLGRILREGSACPNTGIPGAIAGYTHERVLRAPSGGAVAVVKDIGSVVKAGDVLATVGGKPLVATINGLVRGMLRNGFIAHAGMKMADIDPRIEEKENCTTISDKAYAIAGSVLEVIVSYGVC